MTDDGFHDIGISGSDRGRAEISPGIVQLEHAFKTPTLRNVNQRAPYMHDGSVATLSAVIDHYESCGATDPAFVVFQTDGSPTSKAATEHVLCTAARLPIFWQFVGFGDDEFRFLHKLDDLPVPGRRVVDNAGFFAAGTAPSSISDADLYDQLLQEYPQWLTAARAAGIVRG